MTIVAIDHIQLAMPAGEEDRADHFYAEVLGLSIIPKPEPLAARGGRWYQSGAVQIHLGVEADFRPAKKAHPAIVSDDLDGLVADLEASGFPVTKGQQLEDRIQLYCHDPFGNRIELLATT